MACRISFRAAYEGTCYRAEYGRRETNKKPLLLHPVAPPGNSQGRMHEQGLLDCRVQRQRVQV
jgi:hypothetical protein